MNSLIIPNNYSMKYISFLNCSIQSFKTRTFKSCPTGPFCFQEPFVLRAVWCIPSKCQGTKFPQANKRGIYIYIPLSLCHEWTLRPSNIWSIKIFIFQETLRKADEIFGPDNKDLYAVFEGLITRNVHWNLYAETAPNVCQLGFFEITSSVLCSLCCKLN